MVKLRTAIIATLISLLASSAAFAQAQVGAGQIWGNPNASRAPLQPANLSAIIDRAIGSTRGALLERGSTGWLTIGPSTTAGLPFVSNGTGADPAYQAIGVVGGGTGITSYAVGDILYASTSSVLSRLADVATGSALLSGGVGVAPAWGKITSAHLNVTSTSCTNQFLTAISASVGGTCATVNLASAVTGTLPIGNGGTGQTTAAAAISALLPTPTRAGDIVYWNGSAWVTFAGNNSGTQVFSENASGVPGWTTAGIGSMTQIAQGANTTANPGAGINLSTNPCTSSCTVSIDASFMRGYWSGCQMSAPGGASVLTITACVTASDDNTTLMKTTGTYTKSMGSTWSVGSAGGCLDTGSTGANAWYHVYEIIRVDTGVTDFVCTLNATSPTAMPTNYTKQRRIGSFKTDGSGFIVGFVQNYDLFTWLVPVQDVNVANPASGSRQTVTLASVPTGVVVEPNLQWGGDNSSANFNAIITSLSMTDTAPSATLNSFRVAGTGVNPWAGSNIRVVTNTSAQVGYRVDATGASNRITAVTYGWRDPIGR